MATNHNAVKKPLSSLFTTLSVLLFLGGFYLPGSEYLAAKAWYLRLFVALIFVSASVASLRLTEYWTLIISLSRGARIEVRKVFWPKKDELVKTTLMVLLVVAVFAISLSLIDGILNLFVSLVL